MQHFAERTMTESEFQCYQWKPIVRPDDLFVHFCRYCDEQCEPKKWTAKSFQMSISKYLGLKADVRDRSNNGDKMLYNLGNSAEEFIERLRENKLYSRF